MTPTIRRANPSDLESLIRLRILMQVETHKHSAPDDYAQVLRGYFSKALADGSYLGAVAEYEDKVVATGGLCVYAKPPSINGKTGLVGYVTNVYTDVGFRKKGLAGKIMELLIAEGRKAGADRLHLGATADGKRVYERVGFDDPGHPQLEMRL